MSLISFDLETWLIEPGILAPRIVCGSFASSEDDCDLLLRDDSLLRIEQLLRGKDTICGANIAYDFGCVLAARPELFSLVWEAYERGRVYDVQIAATLNAIADGRLRDGDLFRKDGSKVQKGRYSLHECVRESLGRMDAKENDEWRLRYAELDGLPLEKWPPVARQYSVDDAVNTLLVAVQQKASFRNQQDQKPQAHAAFCTHLGAMWGLRTEKKAVDALDTQIREHLVVLQKFALENGLLRAKAARRPNELSKDMKAISERVFSAYDGLPPKTETGRISTSRETLEDSGDPVLEKFAETSKWEKLQTYIPALKEASVVPFNVKPNILVATGRVSYDGLVQLMPRKGGVRECFVARDGTVWSSVDYAAIEMSTLAQVCLWTVGESKLAEAINAGKDPHSLSAAHMVHMPYDEFVRRKDEPELSGIRQAAKASNFGFPGLMGPARFVIAKRREGASVCEWTFRDGRCGEKKVLEWRGNPLDAPLCQRCCEEATKLREHYVDTWTEMKLYWRWVQKEVRGTDTITQFVSKRIRGGLSAPAAANTLFQGLAADGAKRAVVQLTKEMYLDSSSPLYGSRLLVFAHDETLLEIPEERAHEAAMRQAEIMVEQMKTCVPDVRVSAEPALMRRWYKEAKTVLVEGRLVPWEPKGSL